MAGALLRALFALGGLSGGCGAGAGCCGLTFYCGTAVLLCLSAGETLRLPCRGCRPGLGPAADLLFCFAKKVGKKGDPYDGGPLRGLHTPLVPKSGSVRNSLALRQRTLLYPISAPATCRHLTGIHCNGNGNSNFNFNFNFTSNGNGMRLLQGPFDTLAARALRANGLS